MGHVISTYKDPSSMPDILKPPKYDQASGFADGRKVRKLPFVTLAEMNAAGLKPEDRDYCAHYLMGLKKCWQEHAWMLLFRCNHLRHEYLECERDDEVMRMKEYERERRMLARERRKAEA